MFSPATQWISKLEELYLLNPNVLHRNHDFRYLSGILVIVFTTTLLNVRYLLGGFYPDLALRFGNYYNVLGKGGQFISILSSVFVSLTTYFRLRLLAEREVSFFMEIVAYDDPKKQTVLSGKHREKMSKFIDQTINILKIVAVWQVGNFFFTITAIGIVTPLLILGLSVYNVVFWTLTTIMIALPIYYLGTDWVYIFGSWFLCKSHLDFQVDALIDDLEELVKIPNEVDIRKITSLDIKYRKLVTRIKRFDRFSRDLISPYRIIVSYINGAAVFAASLTDNLSFQIGIDSIAATAYVITLVFLSTALSLSVRRRKLYTSMNILYMKVSKNPKTSLRSLLTIRAIVKSLGDGRKPTICLTDKSGEEFDPMELVKFVLGTFSNVILAANLYYEYMSEM